MGEKTAWDKVVALYATLPPVEALMALGEELREELAAYPWARYELLELTAALERLERRGKDGKA